jgi:hypothetical protein
VLGSKPSRDAGNPPVIMLAQAVRIERTWASFRATLGYQQPTPEEIWRAVKESNPARSVLETNPRPAPNPKWRMTGHSKTIPLRIQLGFRPVPAPWLVCHPRWRRQQESNLHGLGKAITGFRPDKHAVACLHEMAEGGVSKLRSVSPSSVFEAAAGDLPATPSIVWRRAVSPSHTPVKVRSV